MTTSDLYTPEELASIRRTNRARKLAMMSTTELAAEIRAKIDSYEKRTGKTSKLRGELYDLTH